MVLNIPSLFNMFPESETTGDGLGSDLQQQIIKNTNYSQIVKLASAAAVITATGLDLTADGIYMIVFKIKHNNAAAGSISFYMNGDTTAANYTKEAANIEGTTVTGINSAASAVLNGSTLGNTKNLTGFGILQRDIDGKAVFNFKCGSGLSTTAFIDEGLIQYETATNITSITLSNNQATGFAIGSQLGVFKIA